MHCLTHVAPLLVRSLVQEPMTYALLPVPLSTQPSADPAAFSVFFKAGGTLVSLHADDALRVRNYMKRHNTEALTSDGRVAFTLHGNQLLECNPDVCGQPPERLFVQFQPMHWAGEAATASGAVEHVDVTDLVLGLPATAISALFDTSEAANALVDPESRGHLGPYVVLCEEPISRFFRVASIRDITAAVVAAKVAGNSSAVHKAAGASYRPTQRRGRNARALRSSWQLPGLR